MTRQSVLIQSALTVIAATLSCASSALAEAASAEPTSSVLDGIVAVERPVQSFLPKYQPELFAGIGYSGTFSTAAHQWPTLVVSPLEGLLFRPGRFDVGAYSELRLGRPDESFGRFEVGVGLELMWRFIETPVSDWAAVLRGAYLIDTTDPNTPLMRPGLGVQVSLVRSLALQLTYDQLHSPSRDFSNGHEFLHGLSVTIKVGLCPSGEFCHQKPEHSVDALDRSAVTCHEASLTCQAARTAGPSTGTVLCDGALRAMDTSHYPADWDDPAGAFLRALRAESNAALPVLDAPLRALEAAHAASMQGLADYAVMQRGLGGSQMLSKNYGYLVTPVMIRDWLGCDASGKPIACATDAVCNSDTGVPP